MTRMPITGIPSNLNVPPVVSGLFQEPERLAPSSEVKKGDLVSFYYVFWKHDQWPLVIVTDILPGRRLRGINIHYLTFSFISTLIIANGSNQTFSYQNIKGQKLFVDAFRTYKTDGIMNLYKFDVETVKRMLADKRLQDPTQIHYARKAFADELRARAKSQPIAKSTFNTQQQQPPGQPTQPESPPAQPNNKP